MAQLKCLIVFLVALGLASASYETNAVKLNTHESKNGMESEAEGANAEPDLQEDFSDVTNRAWPESEGAYADLQEDFGDVTNRAWPEAPFAGVQTIDVGEELQGNKDMAEVAVTTGKCHIHSLYIHVPGPVTLIHVSANINYLWAISSETVNNVYLCARPCKGVWKKIPGTLKQLDVDDQEIWGVNKGYAIFKRPVDGSGKWVHVKGRLIHVSASGNGYIWGVNRGNQIYRCKKPCNGKWIVMGGRLKQVDGGQKYVYGVNSANNIYSAPVDGSKGWRQIPGKLKYVTASGLYDIYGVNIHNNVFRCKKPCLGDFELLSGSLNQCEATVNGLFGTYTGHGIYYRKI